MDIAAPVGWEDEFGEWTDVERNCVGHKKIGNKTNASTYRQRGGPSASPPIQSMVMEVRVVAAGLGPAPSGSTPLSSAEWIRRMNVPPALSSVVER
jgi:hypothetical protein